ncbi:MAG: hypothetical protein ACI9WU_003945 [Myxococcota bacterium]|jgi:hypothetical protein
MARTQYGPFREPLFPKAELDLEMPEMLRYRTEAPFDAIARFYDEEYKDRRDIQRRRGEQDGHPVYTIGVGKQATDVQFATLVVMVDPESLERRKPTWHILVIAR